MARVRRGRSTGGDRPPRGPGRAWATGTDDVTPTNLELVTLTEDEAIITWYTGLTGFDDGLGRMEPAPADAEVWWGTDPTRLDRVATSGCTGTPYHRVRLPGLEPGRTYHYQARSAGRLAAPTVFSLIAGNPVSTSPDLASGVGPFAFTPSRCHRRAASCSPSCSATTSTSARPWPEGWAASRSWPACRRCPATRPIPR